ncbi:HAMP domain-containing sensor histidine kinase [Sinomonas sp. ASV322]|uniref:sensor histidine kinase n=1 Tax=Sinomonas sp. ASV322 TaxID=3041920 RepID=UPI0027DB7324|nr:HAMP domain-containing sensor histidine kinase [Sinomonas sp. ASV322]MDQ4504217.1 HAMP domain-containing sensor histidine kinase [Sinomonas sp. ASV322]
MNQLSGAERRSTVDGGEPGRRWTDPNSWRLRTKLVLATMLLLVAICSVVGSLLYASMDNFLTQQLDTQLLQASRRAVQFGSLSPQQASAGTDQSTPTSHPDPLGARGQGAGTLNARLHGDVLDFQGLINAEGQRVGLPSSDLAVIFSIARSQATQSERPDPSPIDRDLSVGHYRLVAAKSPTGDVIVTGLPLAAKDSALAQLVLTTIIVSGGGLVLIGLVGTYVIRRTLKPLAQVSSVAAKVAQLPLDAGEVALAMRVPPSAAHPGTEVGNVGHALNRMLDNVAGALQARQESEKRVRQFVADASHELRTPLTAIRGYTDMLKMTESLSPQGSESLGRVETQSLRMSRLVEDLLTLARLDEGQPLKLGPVDLTQLVVETVTDQKVIAPDHQWRLALPAEPVEVRADGARLHQVMVNLLSNARKHTEAGTVVTAGVARSAAGDAVITVTDNGPGVPAELQKKVFSRFTRADKARTGTEGSTGLGLSIVQAIVEAHGGSVELSSRPGRTEFAVYLPA